MGLLSFFTGGGAKLIDKMIYSKEERNKDDAAYTAVAMASQNGSGMAGDRTGFDVLVDSVNRMVRPLMTIFVFGGLCGFWQLPDIDAVSGFWQSIIYIIITFWFGGRAITKDIPKMLQALKRIKGG